MKAAYPRRGAGWDLWKQKVVFAAHADSWDFAKDSIFYLRRSTAVRGAKLHFSNMAANTIKTVLKYGGKYNQNKPQTLKLTVANCEVIVFGCINIKDNQSVWNKLGGFGVSHNLIFMMAQQWTWKRRRQVCSWESEFQGGRYSMFNIRYPIFNIQYSISNFQYSMSDITISHLNG